MPTPAVLGNPLATLTESSRARAKRKDADHVASPAAEARVPAYRRIPWTPVAISLAVLLSAPFAVAPIRDAVTLGPVVEARLHLSPGYLAIAPLSDVLDTLTLLGVRQHIALLVTVIVVYALVRVWRHAPAFGSFEAPKRLPIHPLREAGYATVLLLATAAIYAVGAVIPRPMAALALTPADLYLSADFHAHTRFSHDGRPGWEPEDVRAWQRGGGVDVAYIADHRTVQGAELAIANNPAQAGQGTMLLQAIELGWRGEHVNVLNAERVYKGLTTPGLRDVDERSLALASLLIGREPIVIGTIPGRPEQLVPATGPSTAGIRAIELVDGAPRGLDQSRLGRARLLKFADSLQLALVSGSDNHGWGRTVPAWTLMRLPGWRGMGGDSLSYAIDRTLRLGPGATRVVERRVAGELNAPSVLQLVLTVPLVAWRMLTTLSGDERVMWLVWAWGLYLLARLARRRRAGARRAPAP